MATIAKFAHQTSYKLLRTDSWTLIAIRAASGGRRRQAYRHASTGSRNMVNGVRLSPVGPALCDGLRHSQPL